MKITRLILTLLIINLFGCNSTTKLNQDHFAFSNLKSFEQPFQFEGDKDDFYVKGEKIRMELLAQIEGIPVDEVVEYEDTFGPYFYSWEGQDEFGSYFTVAYGNECTESVHLAKQNNEGGIEVLGKVSGGLFCGDAEYEISTEILDDRSFKTTYNEYSVYDLYPTVNIKKSKLVNGELEEENSYNIYAGVSLWNNLALRETADKKGKYLTTVNVGQRFNVSDLDLDAATDEYLKIELINGQKGYILSRLVQPKAIPGAVIAESFLHRRPDILTRTSDVFLPLDVVAIMEMKQADDQMWIKVKGKPEGEKWFKEGWVLIENVSRDNFDLAVAAYANLAREETDAEERRQAYQAILDNSDFENSQLIIWIQERVQ